MKKTGLIVVAGILLTASVVFAECTNIQSSGFDEWGVNYRAHMINGKFCDAQKHPDDCELYRTIDVISKWNDAFLSNADCDGDGALDRHYGFPSYIGSGAWLTNHMKGHYVDWNGEEQRWEFFIKIAAVPSGAFFSGGTWFTDSTMGIEIGPAFAQDPSGPGFAIILETYSDTGSGQHGLLYLSPYHRGLGIF